MWLKKFKQRGQALVLYAVFVPLLIGFVGVGMDLGWYYLNVSRLQNAADAAALAGARKIVESDTVNYRVTSLTNIPSDLKEYNTFYVWNPKKGNNGGYDEKVANTAAGKAEALIYSNKNLMDIEKEHANISERGKVINEWSTVEDLGEVEIETTLYGKVMDINYEEKTKVSRGGTKYYEVKLTEKISHLFLAGFDPMNATVVAYAMLTPEDKSILESIKPLEETRTIGNWEYQNKYGDYKGNWNHFQDKKSHYTAGNDYRTEVINIQQTGGSGQATSANGNKYFSESEVDSLNIDFKIDASFSGKFSSNWDLRTGLPSNGVTRKAINNDGWTTGYKDDLRIHASLNFNDAWADRDESDFQADILWTRIESDPLWTDFQTGINSVRQIIMNVNKSNTATKTVKDANGEDVTYYTQRPFFIFYTGPETNDDKNTTRESQPVVLNLYEDWNAILYMPNSPVIINGNGHTFTGFVIAKEYHRLKTEDDFKSEGYEVIKDGNDTIYIKEENLLTEDALKKLIEDNNYTKTTDDKGNVTLREEVKAPKYLVLSIDKATAKQYASFTDYINATYKTKFLAATGLSESEIATVTFPQGENLCEDEEYVVAKTDIVDAVPANAKVEYVKVLQKVIVDGAETTAEKYIPKATLPYVKVRRNAVRAYVSVYDLQKTRTGDVYGLNTIDDSLALTGNTSNGDLWRPKTDTYNSDKFIKKSLWDNTYTKEYVDSKLEFIESDGLKTFMRKSEIPDDSDKIVAEYRKVTLTEGGVEKVYYIKENLETEEDETDIEPTYYIKTVPNGSKAENAIIISNKGDLQSVPLSLTDEKYTRATNEHEQPEDPGQFIDGKWRRTSTANNDRDYKIPELERVYYKSAFNLSEDSKYSYFQIEELERINYTYLNVDELNKKVKNQSSGKWEDSEELWKVDDMFFTTERASWID